MKNFNEQYFVTNPETHRLFSMANYCDANIFCNEVKGSCMFWTIPSAVDEYQFIMVDDYGNLDEYGFPHTDVASWYVGNEDDDITIDYINNWFEMKKGESKYKYTQF